MPQATKAANGLPDFLGRGLKFDATCDAQQVFVAGPHIRKCCAARLRRLQRTALQKRASISVNEPGNQNVDDVRVDRAPATRRVRASFKRTLFNFKMALVAH